MAVRVRKLARQLGRTPADVLGLLHALGYKRYRSPEDMVADPIAGKARTAAKKGVRPVPVELESVRKSSNRGADGGGAKPDLMASLLPGVQPLDGGPKSAPPPTKKPAKAVRSAAAARQPAQRDQRAPVADASIAEVARMRAALDEALAARDAAVQAQQRAEVARDEALGERDAARTARDEALAARDEAVSQAPAPVDEEESSEAAQTPDQLDALLEGRGLRGRDEHGRALEALVSARRIEAGDLVARDPDSVAELLRDRVVLFDGDVPDHLAGVVGVGVSPDRADLPGKAQLQRLVGRVGEQLLLNGWKKLRAVGVLPLWHGFLKNELDPRVDLHLVPGGPRDRGRAAQDVSGMDVVWLLGVDGDEGAREAWAEAPLLVDGPADMAGALKALVAGLEGA